MRQLVLDGHRAQRAGGFILACTHLSHLEPILVSGIVERQIRWMARVEFYRRRWAAAALNLGGAFPVDRFGCSIRSIRTAVRLAKAGECVGIFPEGGVAQGRQSVLRGAPFKQGVCTIAIEARVPVVPVVVLGTDRLNQLGPWLPFRRGRVYCAFGSDIVPPPRSGSRRGDRIEMAVRLREEFQRVYHDLLSRSGITDEQVP
ncbi:MAG: 1-acyl-sn-glycerol-3-phosphate acyltransferase [Phycisphaerales bacterium]|nr:1-acyl-sn-glycerol-3-phosphate acyltransferase [Phycisphaerales bacterium]